MTDHELANVMTEYTYEIYFLLALQRIYQNRKTDYAKDMLQRIDERLKELDV